MAHFAHINKEGIVDQVIVIELDVLKEAGGWMVNDVFAPFEEWVQTSYNTLGGEYKKGNTPQEKLSLILSGKAEDMTARNRKNYAGIGFTYDAKRDAFIPPQPYPSWILNEETCQWEAPVPQPKHDRTTEKYLWDEKLTDWVREALPEKIITK